MTVSVCEVENTTKSIPIPAPVKLGASIGTNTMFGILSGGMSVATRLVTIPIVIAHLGLGGYGIWSIIMTAATYMRFGTVGVKSAFQKYVGEATGSGDYEKASDLCFGARPDCILFESARQQRWRPVSVHESDERFHFCAGIDHGHVQRRRCV
jgi:hypothetical protein